MILIVGNSKDQAKPVTDTIKDLSDKRIVFFKSDLCLEDEGIGFACENGVFQAFADVDSESVDLSEITKVWFWKPMLPKELRDYEPHEDGVFIYRQFLTMWRSLASVLSHADWVNDYYRVLEAEHKPFQIKTASEIGFCVPETLITSNPDRARAFWRHCNEQMIMKTLAVNPFPNKVVFTNKVTGETMESIDRIRSAPVILQKHIAGKAELRITVVDQEVYTASVKSESTVDWRRGVVEGYPFELPREIRDLCVKLVSVLGLRFGCIDMIVDEDDRYYFLEINPNGQWQFVQEWTGFPIGESIARILAEE